MAKRNTNSPIRISNYAESAGLCVAYYNPGDNPLWKLFRGTGHDFFESGEIARFNKSGEVLAFINGYRAAQIMIQPTE